MEAVVDVDARGRTTLRAGKALRRRYLETDLPDGTVILHPAVLMSEVQARLLAAPELLASLTAANDRDQSELIRRPRRARRAVPGS